MQLRDSRWTILSEVLRAGVGGFSFFLLAKALGPASYGLVSAAAAVTLILNPTVTCGAFWLAQSDPDSDLRTRLASGLWITAVVVTPVSVLLGLVAPLWIQGIDSRSAALLLLAEGGLQWLLTFIAACELGRGQSRRYFLYMSLAVLARFVACALTYATSRTIESWANYFFICTLVVASGACLRSAGGMPRVSNEWLRQRWQRGIGFSAVGTSTSLLDQADKYLALVVLSAHAAGLYGFAFRLISYALVPVRGVSVRAFPEYFRLVREDETLTLTSFLMTTARQSSALGSGAAVPIVGASYVITHVFLPEFGGTTVLCAILGLNVGLRSWHYALGDALYALRCAKYRTVAIWASGGVALPTSYVFMSQWGLVGAGAAAVVSEGLAVSILAWSFRRALLAHGRAVDIVENQPSDGSAPRRKTEEEASP